MTTGRSSSVVRYVQMAQNGEGTDRKSSIRGSVTRAQTMMCLMLFLSALVSFANAQASRSKKASSKAANPTNGSPTTFTLDVDQMYCDESLPYSYRSKPGKLELTIGNALKNRAPVPSAGQKTGAAPDDTGWKNVLKSDWDKFAKASASPPIFFDSGNNSTSNGPQFVDDPGFAPATGASAEAPTDKGYLNDSGDPILFNPAKEFSTDTYDAQRLLVRTLFGPNPFPVACAYPYLKYPDGDDKKEPLHIGAGGETIALLSKGAGYPLSLNDKDAPQYYLINIVRWKDATAPKDAAPNAGSNPPSNAGHPVPFFQAASDDWYLFNYSEAKDRKQDISQWFHKITPSLMSQTLRIIGSDKVMFLGIHLAPLPALDTKPYMGIANPNPKSAPATEQAWFDAVTLKYTFEASAATPTNMADLNTLLSILLGNLTSLAPAKAAAAVPGPGVLLPKTIEEALTKLEATVQAANEALDQEGNEEQRLDSDLDRFLHQGDIVAALGPLNLASPKDQHYGIEKDQSGREDPNGKSKLPVVTQPNAGPIGAKISLDSSVETNLTDLSKIDSSKDAAKAKDQSDALTAIQQDIDSVSQMQAAINTRSGALKRALETSLVLSTYQGRYAAGLLTNLQNLPVTLASNWNATFVALPNLTQWSSNSGVYDLTKPATTDADKSNRACVPPTMPDATKDTKPSMYPGCNAVSTSSVTGLPDAPSSPVIAFSAHHGFGPSLPLDDDSGQTDSVKESQQVSSAAAQDSSSSKPATTSGSPARPAKSKSAKNSTNNATAATSTICTVSLTKGKTTDNPQTLQHQSDCSDQQTKILDEGPARWDFSFIVPVNGYKDVTFQSGSSSTSSSSSTPNIITAKSITRENAYGVADLFLVPEDLVDRPYIGIPHVVLGLPFAGKVFNKPYFAVGETINIPKLLAKWKALQNVPILGNLAQKDLPVFVRPVFGWVDNKVFPAGGAPTYRSWKPQWAVEMSFSSIKDAVSTFGKKSSKGSGNTTKQTTPSSVPDSD